MRRRGNAGFVGMQLNRCELLNNDKVNVVADQLATGCETCQVASRMFAWALKFFATKNDRVFDMS